MKRPLLLSSILAFVCLFFIAGAWAATSLYVSSEAADLKSDSSSSSETLAILKRGTALTLMETDGRWYKVATANRESGWIYRGKVSEEAPDIASADEEAAGLGGLLGGLSGSDINADAADSSRSIRGLSPEAKEYAEAAGTPQQSRDALDSVLARSVKTVEIEQFLQAGKIGAYAE